MSCSSWVRVSSWSCCGLISKVEALARLEAAELAALELERVVYSAYAPTRHAAREVVGCWIVEGRPHVVPRPVVAEEHLEVVVAVARPAEVVYVAIIRLVGLLVEVYDDLRLISPRGRCLGTGEELRPGGSVAHEDREGEGEEKVHLRPPWPSWSY